MSTPGGWRRSALGTLARVQGGYAFKSADFSDSGIPIVRMSNLRNGRLALTEAARVQPEIVQPLSAFSLRAGDLLIGLSGSLENFGEVRACDLPCYLNQRVGRFVQEESASLHYRLLRHLIQTDMFREAIAVMAVGAAQLNVSPQEIGSIELPVPPLREQKKIAAILSSIDEAIETTQAVIDQLQVAKKAMMTELLTRGLPGRHTRFKQTEIGEVPEEWSVFTVGELLATGVLLDVQDGNHGAQHPKAADFVQSGVPFVMARDVVGGAINLSTCAFIRREQAEGLRIGFARPADVLLTHKGTIGRVGMVPTGMDYVVLTPQVTYYRTTPGKLLPVFLAASLEAEPLQRQLGMLAKQSTRDYIGITAQRQLQLALPTIEEQERLATAAQRFTNYLAQSEAELAARHMVKSALMSVLLTGEVRVKPDYEAA